MSAQATETPTIETQQTPPPGEIKTQTAPEYSPGPKHENVIDHKVAVPEQAEDYSFANDPLLRQMMEDLGEKVAPLPAKEDEEDEEKPKDEKPADEKSKEGETKPATPPAGETKPGEEKPKDGEKAGETQPAKPEEKRIRFDDVLEGIHRPDVTPVAAAIPAQPAKKTEVNPDQGYIDGLPPESQNEFHDYADAERFMPAKYAGHQKKLTAFYKQLDALHDRLRTEDPTRTFDENDDGFIKARNALLRTKPTINSADLRSIMRSAESERATEAAQRATEPVMSEMDRRVRAMEETPRIEAAVKKFDGLMRESFGTDETVKTVLEEIAATGKELGEEEAKAAFAMEMDIITSRTDDAQELVREYLKSQSRISKVDAKNLTPPQQRLVRFLADAGQGYAASNPKPKDGRKFVPIHVYNKLVADDAANVDKLWTFSPAQVIGLIALKATREIAGEISGRRQELSRYGYEKKPAKKKDETQTGDKKKDDIKAIEPPKGKAPILKGSAEAGKPKGDGKHPMSPDDPFNPINAYNLKE